jgi:hypothetical protein
VEKATIRDCLILIVGLSLLLVLYALVMIHPRLVVVEESTTDNNVRTSWLRLVQIAKSSTPRLGYERNGIFHLDTLSLRQHEAASHNFIQGEKIREEKNMVEDYANKKTWNKQPRRRDRIRTFFLEPNYTPDLSKALRREFGIDLKYTMNAFSAFNPERYPYPHVFTSADYSALRLSINASLMGPHTSSSSFQVISMLTDKLKFNQYLRENGFAKYAPKYYESVEAVDSFPVILKRTDLTASHGVFYASNKHALQELFKTQKMFKEDAISPFKTFSDKLGPRKSFFIQEYVDSSKDRSIHFTALNGRVLRFLCSERIRPVDSKVLTWTKEFFDSTPPEIPATQCHFDILNDLIRQLNYTGIGNLDLRVEDKTNTPKLIECNPRISGTVIRNVTMMASFLCSLTFDGEGITSPTGCIRGRSKITGFK